MAVITKAMGAFLILMIFGFKYYAEDTAASHEANNAISQLEQTRKALGAAEQALQQAGIPQADVETLKRELAPARAALAEAQTLIAQLKTRLDQRASQINRLSQEKAELNATIERLRNEAEPLKNKVAELSKEVEDLRARLQAEIARNAELDAKIKALLNQVDKLTNDVADRDRQIETLVAAAQERDRQIAALQGQVDQLNIDKRKAEARLEASVAENTALKQAIQPLKQQERLMQNMLTFTFLVGACPGLSPSFYIGHTPAGNDPPVDRTAQGRARTSDKIITSNLDGAATSLRFANWAVGDLKAGDVLTIYGKLLNARPDALHDGLSQSDKRCQFSITITPGPATRINRTIGAQSGFLLESEPFGILNKIRLQPDGIVVLPIDAAERAAFQKSIAAAPCAGLSCGWASSEAKPHLREGFVNRFLPLLAPPNLVKDTSETDTIRAFLDDLGGRLERGEITLAAATDWVSFIQTTSRQSFKQQPVPVGSFERWAFRLREAGAPESVIAEIRRRVAEGWFSADELPLWLSQRGIDAKDLPDGARVRKTLSALDVDVAMQDELASMVDSGKAKPEEAITLGQMLANQGDIRAAEHLERAATEAGLSDSLSAKLRHQVALGLTSESNLDAILRAIGTRQHRDHER